MTSLQRAAQVVTKRGALESSFAAGLDLSELGSRNSGGTSTSAAAELLRVKAQHMEQTAHDEREDKRLEKLAMMRAQHLQDALFPDQNNRNQSKAVTAPHPSSSQQHTSATSEDWMNQTNVFHTLVHMHGGDEHGGSKVQQKLLLTGDKRRKNGPTTSFGKVSKGGAVKKSKRSKY